MLKRLVLPCLLAMSTALFGQAAPSAEGAAGNLWVGAEISTFNPDWGCTTNNSPFSCWSTQLQGIGAFGDLNRIAGHLGLEAEGRWLEWHGPTGITMSNYLAGPRYQLLSGQRLSLNVKVLGGISWFNKNSQWGGWATFAPGATVGYRLSERFMLRGDYEYQSWPGFEAAPGHDHGLTPNGLSLGVSYRLR